MSSLTPLDYVVFILVLVVSVAIGVYHAWKGVTRTEEFFVASRQLKLLPVSFSILASWVSGIAILGISSDCYSSGTMVIYFVFNFLPATAITAHFFVPIYYRLCLNSVYEVG